MDLGKAFAGYTEEPHHSGDTLHVLKFLLGRNVSIDSLFEAFDVSNGNSISSFSVDCNQEDPTTVNPEGFLEVFLQVNQDADGVGVVYLTTPGDFRARPTKGTQNPPQVEPVTELVQIPQVAPAQVTFS